MSGADMETDLGAFAYHVMTTPNRPTDVSAKIDDGIDRGIDHSIDHGIDDGIVSTKPKPAWWPPCTTPLADGVNDDDKIPSAAGASGPPPTDLLAKLDDGIDHDIVSAKPKPAWCPPSTCPNTIPSVSGAFGTLIKAPQTFGTLIGKKRVLPPTLLMANILKQRDLDVKRRKKERPERLAIQRRTLDLAQAQLDDEEYENSPDNLCIYCRDFIYHGLCYGCEGNKADYTKHPCQGYDDHGMCPHCDLDINSFL